MKKYIPIIIVITMMVIVGFIIPLILFGDGK